VLGVDWTYERIEVPAGGLDAFVSGLDESWRGLSVTMPLKREALEFVDDASAIATLTLAVNTIALTDSGSSGSNTDVRGIVAALRGNGLPEPRTPWILGAGATATSVVAALGRLGASHAFVSARRPEQADALVGRAAKFEVDVTVVPWERATRVEGADLIINTVPWGADAGLAFRDEVRAAVPLFEIVYDPWPSPLAQAWLDADGTVISGLDLLLHQAVAQVRIFVSGDEDAPLPDEHDVVAAMRAAVAG